VAPGEPESQAVAADDFSQAAPEVSDEDIPF
jgi:hypothetical protein